MYAKEVPVQPFTYARPSSLQEALEVISQYKGRFRPIVGGTDLVDQMKRGRRTPALVLDVKYIPETTRIEYTPADGLRLGSAVSCTRTYEHPAVVKNYPAIAEAAHLVGSLQIQNRASIGGNICNAAPSADTAPPMLVYEARAIIAGPRGRREVPLDQFFTGPGQTVLADDEILVELAVPPPPPNSSSHYLRFIPREEMDIAVAGVASLLTLDRRTQRCTRARIALAAVAPTPLRARDAEAALEGKVVTEELLAQAGELAAKAARPITDVRGSAEYRRELVKVLTRRTLQACLERLGVR